MDAMDVVTGDLHAENDASVIMSEIIPPKTSSQLVQEEKREDNSSSGHSISEDEIEQDLDLPTTQLLVQEPADEELQDSEMKKLPSSPVVVRSPANVRVSPARLRKSPVKARASPNKATVSPIKMKSPVKARSSSVKAPNLIAASSPITASLANEEGAVGDDEIPEEFRAKGSEGKFTKVFPTVAKLVESGGWQIAQGHNTMFCAMPGVQFFNFKPNINVFDSKIKACWKFIQMAGEKKKDTEDTELWDTLWPIAENDFGWFTMMCGSETWYVKPHTKFENFQPNETIFQTKKRAVLKCLAVEVGEIELGDSSDGHQVIAFAPREKQPAAPAPASKKVKTSLFTTPSPAVNNSTRKRTTSGSSSSSKLITPAKRVSPSVGSTSGKRKLSSSRSKVTTSASKKTTKASNNLGAKKATKKKKEKTVPETAPDGSKGDEFQFTPPEFRCSFGIVYAKLQEEGWYHRNGIFEYDYFSPTYTDATKEVKVNYFQSQADLEEFLKVSGTWKRIEDELREEHDEAVDEEREKALDRHHQRLEQQATRRRNIALYGAPPAVAKPKKSSKKVPSKKGTPAAPRVPQTLYQAEVEAAKAVEAKEARLSKMPKLKFGSVLDKLIKRGWYYRPGRFEYDYFKPGTNPKAAVAGEDRFESAADLEVYLKTTGLWEEIAKELAHDELAQHDNQSAEERPVKRSKLASPPVDSSQPLDRASNGGVQKDDVNAITNDIWANSHEFDFNE